LSFESLLSLCLGLGLSAACGFRVFVPLLVVNLAARAGWVHLSGELAWMGETTALWTFGVATVLEIGAYYIAWLDNLLDTVATPVAVVAGAVVTASVVTDVDPAMKWMLAVIAGGGVAGAVQTATVGGRILSSVTTAGIGNPVVATIELFSSFFLSILALLMPLLAAMFVLFLLMLLWRHRRRRRAAT
jgi:hypothetical protein